MPGGEEAAQDLDRHRLDFTAQRGQGFPAQGPEHVGVAILTTSLARPEFAGDDVAPAGEPTESILDLSNG